MPTHAEPQCRKGFAGSMPRKGGKFSKLVDVVLFEIVERDAILCGTPTDMPWLPAVTWDILFSSILSFGLSSVFFGLGSSVFCVGVPCSFSFSGFWKVFIYAGIGIGILFAGVIIVCA